MSIQLTLQRGAELPLYRQIADQIRDHIYSGALPAGSQLPTVRSLAKNSGVTRITVQTAYAELQSAGWVEATVGRGTFVSENARRAQQIPLRDAPLTAQVVIDDMLQISRVQGVRSMANASPDPRLFPAQDFWNVLADLRADAHLLSEYGSTQGDEQLRIEIAGLLAERGVAAMPGEILVTNGATQALSLITQVLCRPGDTVLVEEPTYLSFLNILRAQGVHAVGVPMDDEGILPDALERFASQTRPRFLYTIPTFQNPTGSTMSSTRRQAIQEVALRQGFLIVEDDLYARIAFDGTPPPAIKASDDAENVIYVSSFSKTLMPGLRVGYLHAPAPLLHQLIELKRATDLCGPPLMQRAIAGFIRCDGYRRHLRRVIPLYRERRDTLIRALAASMPQGVTWTVPAGGYCCWLTLPQQGFYNDLYAAAMRAGWAIAPGNVFLAQPRTGSAIRICFGQQDPPTLRHGVEVLAQLIRARKASAVVVPTAAAEWSPMKYGV